MTPEIVGVMVMLGAVWLFVTFVAAIIVAVDVIQIAHYSKMQADEARKQTALLQRQNDVMEGDG